MQVQIEDIYVIDPKMYKGYQENQRRALKTLILTTTIKILLIILLLVVSYFGYKIIEKKIYLGKKSTESTLLQEKSSQEVYIEVLAKRIERQRASLPITKIENQPLVSKKQSSRQEVAVLSSSYIEKMREALNHGL
jgi:hypothetical protein